MCTKYKIVPFCPYHFVRTILSNTILSVYHFVSTILSATILSGRPPFCSRPRLFHLLIVTSLHYFFKVSIVSLSVCYVIIALFSASIVPSSVCCISMLYLEGFRCFFFRSDGCVIALLPASAVSSSVCCVTILFIQALYCFIICLLRHCSLLGFVIVIVIVISKLLKRYSKAKRTRAPAYSRALRRIKGGFQRGVKRSSGPDSRVAVRVGVVEMGRGNDQKGQGRR